MALSGDTLSVFMEGYNEGILKYHVNPSTHHLTFVSASNYPLNATIDERVFMATDDSLLYLSSNIDSLKAVSLHAPHTRVAVFDHSADFVWDRYWGVHDLYYSQGLLVLNEYMGQSSIFGAPTVVSATEPAPQMRVRAYPNPSGSKFALEWSGGFPLQVQVHDMSGRLVGEWANLLPNEPLDASLWPTGIYALQWTGLQSHGLIRIVRQ